ncbi:hypothetical protein D3C78_1758380 [compost metagenome]
MLRQPSSVFWMLSGATAAAGLAVSSRNSVLNSRAKNLNRGCLKPAVRQMADVCIPEALCSFPRPLGLMLHLL